LRPFVDYYKANNISPVAQNIDDLDAHFARRRHLARLLGVVPALIEGGSVLEFGPGTGHNALWVLAQRPARYDLVDGNPVGLVQARELLVPRCPATTSLTIREAMIEEVAPEPIYDLVLAEGLLPTQNDPAGLLRHMAGFVKPGGVLVVTAMDGVSVLAERLCHLYSMAAVPADRPIDEQAKVLAELWGAHLSTLKAMTRGHVDWVLDNILHPWRGRLFSVAEVIETVTDEFDILGTSPHFLQEWRWYKDLRQADCGANRSAVADYMANLHNFLDYRGLAEPRPDADNQTLMQLSSEVVREISMLTPGATPGEVAPIVEKVRELHKVIARISARTAQSVGDFLAVIDTDGFVLKPTRSFASFEGWFGRGQQYISMTRRC